jgi:Xaa-Pro aminopeptidase
VGGRIPSDSEHTVNPLFPREDLDLGRMRRDRLARLQAAMERRGIDVLVLGGTGNVHYATGARWAAAELGRSVHEPAIAIVDGSGLPHLFTAYPEGAPPDLPSAHVHPPLAPEFVEGVGALAAAVRDVAGPGELTVAIDELSAPAYLHLPHLLGQASVLGADEVLGEAKLLKTDDEIECIRRSQRINELAMYDVYASLRPGVRQNELSAIFLRRIFELGATANCIDPIWQATPRALADGPWTVHGDLAFPTASSDRILREDDLLLVDTGILYEGYASDFGRTWWPGSRGPTAREGEQLRRWKAVVERVLAATKPGATGLELARAACEDEPARRPWLDHFYLVHGVGTESAEMPFIGTDLGDAFDESIVLQPGMVMVLEPVIWDDGEGGYRAEDIVAVTEDGYRMLSDFPYMPFEAGSRP